MKKLTLAAALALMSAPAFAESHASGDAAAGAEAFDRQCASCHTVIDAEGVRLAGRGSDVGPNLFALAGSTAAAVEGYDFGDSIIAYGATGAVWDEATFMAYVMDPTDFLRTALEDRRARSKMAFKVRSEDDARNLYAYLVSLVPAE